MAFLQQSDVKEIDIVSLYRNRIEESLGLIQLMGAEQKTEAWALWQQATSLIVGLIPELSANNKLVIHLQHPDNAPTVQEDAESEHDDDASSTSQTEDNQVPLAEDLEEHETTNSLESANPATSNVAVPGNGQPQDIVISNPGTSGNTLVENSVPTVQNILLIDKNGQVIVEPFDRLSGESGSETSIITNLTGIPDIKSDMSGEQLDLIKHEHENSGTEQLDLIKHEHENAGTDTDESHEEMSHMDVTQSAPVRKSTRTLKINPNSPLAGIMQRLQRSSARNACTSDDSPERPIAAEKDDLLVNDSTITTTKTDGTVVKTDEGSVERADSDGTKSSKVTHQLKSDVVSAKRKLKLTVRADGTVALYKIHSETASLDKENESDIAVELIKLSESSASDAVTKESYPGLKKVTKSRGPYTKRIKLDDSVEDSCKCPTCDKVLANRSNLAVHMRVHSGERPFQCALCEKSFTTKPNLQRHERTHYGEKPYECPECLKRFTEKKSMVIHQRSHTGEKPYKCDKCGTCFTQQGSLKAHQHLHTGYKGHLCQICGKSFRQKSQLRTHMLRHTNTRNFPCKICSKAFVSKGDLERHWLHHTGERPFLCSLCPRTFTRLQYLNEHMNAHTGSKPYMCKVCGERFADVSSCSRHTKRHETSDHSRYIKRESSGAEFIVVECEANQVLETVHHLQESTGETLLLNGENVYLSNTGSLKHEDGEEIRDVNLSIPVTMLDKPGNKSQDTEEEDLKNSAESSMSKKLEGQSADLTHGGSDQPADSNLVSNIGTLIDGSPPPNVTLVKSDETLDDTLFDEADKTHHTVTIVTSDGSQHIIELPTAVRSFPPALETSDDGTEETSVGDNTGTSTITDETEGHTLLFDGDTNTIQVITYPTNLSETGDSSSPAAHTSKPDPHQKESEPKDNDITSVFTI